MSGIRKLIADLGGKKFVMSIFGVLAIVLQEKCGISEDQTMYIAGIVATFVGSQGLADGLSKGATSSQAAKAAE